MKITLNNSTSTTPLLDAADRTDLLTYIAYLEETLETAHRDGKVLLSYDKWFQEAMEARILAHAKMGKRG